MAFEPQTPEEIQRETEYRRKQMRAQFDEARPWLRNIGAFLLHAMKPGVTKEAAYPVVDNFLSELERDLDLK